jgi:hypothetical protein
LCTCVEAGHGPVDGERLAEQARGAMQLAVVVVEVAVGAAHQVLPVLGARGGARAARRAVRTHLALATLAAVHVQTYSCEIQAKQMIYELLVWFENNGHAPNLYIVFFYLKRSKN